MPRRSARRHVAGALDLDHASAHCRIADLPGTAPGIESATMRFDTALFHHVGEPRDRSLPSDERHETIPRADALEYRPCPLRFPVPGSRRTDSPFAQVKRGLRLFAEEIMPRLAESDSASGSNPLPEPVEQDA